MPRSVGNLRLDVGRRVDAVDDEQGQKGEEPEAFTDALTRILQPFDPTVSAGTNSGLHDSTAGKPKYVSIVASGAVQQAGESTDATSLGKNPLTLTRMHRRVSVACAIATTLLAHACGCECVGARLCFCL